MNKATDLEAKLRRATVWSGRLVIAIGLLTIVGWLTNCKILVTFSSNSQSMKAITALMIIVCGIILINLVKTKQTSLHRRLIRCLILIPFGLGLATLGSYFLYLSGFTQTHWSMGVQLPLEKQNIWVWMAPTAASQFVLFSLSAWFALRIKKSSQVYLHQSFAFLGFLLGFLGILAFLFGVSYFFENVPFSHINLSTALSFSILFFGLVIVHPHRGLVRVFLGSHSVNILARRLLLASLIMPFLINLLTSSGYHQGLYPLLTAFTLMVILSTLTSVVLVIAGVFFIRINDQSKVKADILLQNSFVRQIKLNADLENRNHTLQIQEEKLRETNEIFTQTLHRLEERNFELDQFVYKTSHDLRSPLVTMLGLVNLMKEEKDPAQWQQYASLIENRIIKADDFVKSMLDYARNTRTNLQMQDVDFHQLIDNAFSNLEYLPTFGLIEKQVEISGMCASFCSDTFRLQTVFLNLISNAVKYADNEKKSLVRITVTISESEARVSVYDNGIGISEEYLLHIFEMFSRGTNLSIGSGLGMYIVKQSIEKLKGSIEVKSQLGIFTDIILRIPNLTFVK